jgi:phage terminase large subunit GpA-like protein
MTVPEWADKYRRLSPITTARPGPWRTTTVEVARGPMLSVTEPGVETITVMTCTQLLKTSLLENTMGYFAHLDPSPMLLAQPKDDAARKFVKERLNLMAKESPVLRPLLSAARERGGESTWNFRPYPGGFLAIESAGSPTNLAMRAIRITLADEIDKWENSPKEGDPLPLLEERTSTFMSRKKKIRACSPTWTETSRIYKSYLEGDQRRPYIACPHCRYQSTWQFFKHVHWAKDEDDGTHNPFSAAIICENCGETITEQQRQKLLSTEGAVKWRQTRPFECCGERQEPMKERLWRWDAKNQVGRAKCKHCGKDGVSNLHASFTASKLFSPFETVVKMATQWLDSKNDLEKKQTFYNTWLGEPFELQVTKSLEGAGLMKRREEYAAQVPAGVVRLTMGVDVQPGTKANEGRLEYEIVGWGRGEESWSIKHDVLVGDPAKPEVWAELDAIINSSFEYERGGRMIISGTCIDSGGHNTQDVYNFCRPRNSRNVWAIKGVSDRSGQWAPVWPIPKQERGKFKLTGFRPVMIGVNAAKESIRQKLFVETPGPGFAHFNMEWHEGRFAQLTSEQLVIERKQDTNIRRWVLKRGHANEALDVRVYAYAALCGLMAVKKLNLDRAADHFEAMLPTTPGDPTKPPEPPKPPTKPPRPPVRRSRWADGG